MYEQSADVQVIATHRDCLRVHSTKFMETHTVRPKTFRTMLCSPGNPPHCLKVLSYTYGYFDIYVFINTDSSVKEYWISDKITKTCEHQLSLRH